MIRRPPRSTRTDTLFPYTTLFRSLDVRQALSGGQGLIATLGLHYVADISLSPTSNGEPIRSEEHTSELQSLMRISYAVFCLKKKTTHISTSIYVNIISYYLRYV